VSQLKTTDPIAPVIHIPSFKSWGIQGYYVAQAIKGLGLENLYPGGVHAWYWYTDEDGIAVLLPDLILKSSLYKQDRFTCINYAYKVWNECSQRFGLNTWLPVIGRIPDVEVRHAWNLILVGNENGLLPSKFLYFEPNDGWEFNKELETAYQAFPIGEEGYKGEMIFY